MPFFYSLKNDCITFSWIVTSKHAKLQLNQLRNNHIESPKHIEPPKTHSTPKPHRTPQNGLGKSTQRCVVYTCGIHDHTTR